MNGFELFCRLFRVAGLVQWELSLETKLHLDAVMDLIVVIKDDVVVQFRIGLVSLNPLSLHTVVLPLHISRSFC